jgi:hypothetical protein
LRGKRTFVEFAAPVHVTANTACRRKDVHKETPDLPLPSKAGVETAMTEAQPG